jgi:hypothetical protein
MPTRLRDLTDTDLQNLDSTKNKYVMRYSASADKFVLVTADQVLSTSSEDNDLPDDFVTQVEQEVDINNIVFGIDGGTF